MTDHRRSTAPWGFSNFYIHQSHYDDMAEAARLKEGEAIIDIQEPMPHHTHYVRPPMPYDKFLDERRKKEGKPRR